MNPLLQTIPTGHIWIEVLDLPSALLALEFLMDHAKQCNSDFDPCGTDTL